MNRLFYGSKQKERGYFYSGGFISVINKLPEIYGSVISPENIQFVITCIFGQKGVKSSTTVSECCVVSVLTDGQRANKVCIPGS